MRTLPTAFGLITAALLAAPLSAQAGPAALVSGWSASAVTVSQPSLDTPATPQEAGRNRLKGALWGGGIGLVAGGILGGLSVQSDDDDPGSSLVDAAATGPAVVLGALVGAGVGALLGATVFAPSRPAPSGAEGGMAVLVAPRRAGDGTGVSVGLRLLR